MSDFTLPSGRVLTIKERPKWGDMRAATNAGMAAERDGNHYGHARATVLMARMTGLSVEEIDDLDFDDEEALATEVGRRTEPRGPKEEAPFETPSQPS